MNKADAIEITKLAQRLTLLLLHQGLTMEDVARRQRAAASEGRALSEQDLIELADKSAAALDALKHAREGLNAEGAGMINPNQLMAFVIRPVLKELRMGGEDAELLVLETGMQESLLCHLDQLSTGIEKPGPAYGIFQMEKATHDDIWNTWLAFRPDVARVVRSFSFQHGAGAPDVDELHGNLYYAVAMCRCRYRRVPDGLPRTRIGRAAYWKQFYNTSYGKGTVDEYLDHAGQLHHVYSGGRREESTAS